MKVPFPMLVPMPLRADPFRNLYAQLDDTPAGKAALRALVVTLGQGQCEEALVWTVNHSHPHQNNIFRHLIRQVNLKTVTESAILNHQLKLLARLPLTPAQWGEAAHAAFGQEASEKVLLAKSPETVIPALLENSLALDERIPPHVLRAIDQLDPQRWSRQALLVATMASVVDHGLWNLASDEDAVGWVLARVGPTGCGHSAHVDGVLARLPDRPNQPVPVTPLLTVLRDTWTRGQSTPLLLQAALESVRGRVSPEAFLDALLVGVPTDALDTVAKSLQAVPLHPSWKAAWRSDPRLPRLIAEGRLEGLAQHPVPTPSRPRVRP